MTGLQSFHEQEVRIENENCKEITSEGKDATIIGSLTENFEQNLTRSDENLADILVDLDQKNIVFNIDINEELNVSDAGDKFPKVFLPEADQNKTAAFKDFILSKKNQRPKVQLLKRVI